MKRDHQVTGNIGLCWNCYQLSQLGWNAMPTARNARGVDVIAYNRACTKTISIQVKTLSKRSPVPRCLAVIRRTSPAGRGSTRNCIVAVTLP